MTDLRTGDCLQVMPTLPQNSVDSIITDPPYGLDFMGKEWDHGVPGVEFWQAALRVAKPGAILMAFGGTRTFHRLACAIEDAGWEIRDCMMWLYGSGFPKSLDISKAIEKEHGVQPIGSKPPSLGMANNPQWNPCHQQFVMPPTQTDAGKSWQGYGTALKPAHEDIIIAQKPLDAQTERGIIVANLYQLEAQLWSLLDVNTAEKLFKSNRPDYDAACAFARWSACEKQSIQEGLFAQMDTLQFASVMTSCLNTVMSWSNTLADALDDGKMSTTETESSQTIDLKTLSFCLSALTPSSIIKAATMQPGLWQNALPAARYLSAVVAKLNSTPQRFAAESATVRALISQQGEEGLNLTPDFSPIIVAMKPLEGTYAENAQKWGVAGLDIDGSRIGVDDVVTHGGGRQSTENWRMTKEVGTTHQGRWPANLLLDEDSARLLDEQSGESKSSGVINRWKDGAKPFGGGAGHPYESVQGVADSGGASRFFYTAKASSSERNAGLEGVMTWESVDLKEDLQKVLSLVRDTSDVLIPLQDGSAWRTILYGSNTTDPSLLAMKSTIETVTSLITGLRTSNFCLTSTTRDSILDAIRTLTADGSSLASIVDRLSRLILNTTNEQTVSALGAVLAVLRTLLPISEKGRHGNIHSTVKPVDLMRYLCKLTRTPTGGVVLDPFMGSGTTGIACVLEHRDFIGIELNAEYAEIARKRIAYAEGPLFAEAA